MRGGRAHWATSWLAGCLCWLTSAMPALACSLAEWPSLAQRFAKASDVFVAHIVRTAEGERVEIFGGIVRAIIRPTEILKGRTPPDLTVGSFLYGIGNCSIPMITGLDYVFLLEDGSPLVIMGQAWTISADDPESVKNLDELRALARRRQ